MPPTRLRLFTPAPLIAALVLLTSILAATPASAALRHLSITATPATALVRTTVVISGTLAPRKAGVRLVLQRKIGKTWVTLAHATTGSGGAYAVKVLTPKKAASWVVRTTTKVTGTTPSLSSAAVRVRVVKTRFGVTATAPGLTGVKAIAAGGATAYALLSNGTVWSWGANDTGQLGNGGGADSSVPVQVSGLTGITKIASGLALRSDGTVWAWGANNYGRLGDSTTTERDTPVPVSGLTGVIAIDEGAYNGYALTDDHEVWAWGFNTDLELGRATPSESHVPLPVPGATNVTAIAAGQFNCYALLSDHTVTAWGWNMFGQLGAGTNAGDSPPIAVVGLSNAVAIGTGPTSASGYAVVAG